MWQILAAAAVAGSGLVAKRFLGTNAADEPFNVFQRIDQECEHPSECDRSSQNEDSALSNGDDCNDVADSQKSTVCDESIFRFSSASRFPGRVGSQNSGKNWRKKSGFGTRRSRGNAEGFIHSGYGKVEKKCEGLGDGDEVFKLMNQRKSVKRFSIRLKKARTSKHAIANCETCVTKDNSKFDWGLGLGMIYMMSAGKAEIDRLNMAMDETAKVVKELKTEICRRKTIHSLHETGCRVEVEDKVKEDEHARPMFTKSSSDGIDNEVSFVSLVDEGECSSSVLTEEQQPGVMEMYQLETELETELQKLHLCANGSGLLDEAREYTSETRVPADEYCRQDGKNLNFCHVSGVSPSELNQKLCHVLIEQQENQIVELESELNRTNSKLHEKETELLALKDCVRRLTEFSLASISDEETEAQLGEDQLASDEAHKKKESHSHGSIVGMKRLMEFE